MEQTAVEVVAAAAVVLALAAGMSVLCRLARQPAVIGQILAGILLGPSVLGRISPSVADAVVPAEVRSYIFVVAQVGLVFFLFAVGADLDMRLLRQHKSVVPAICAGAFVLPLAAGAASGLLLWVAAPQFIGSHAVHTTFVLFLAVALSITAVPVLAAIIDERGLARTTAGTVSLACAGVMDVAAWSILAIVVGLAGGHGSMASRWWLVPVYLAALLFTRLVLRWWLGRATAPSTWQLPVVAAFATASAWATGQLGFHLIFGALLAGVLLPRSTADSDNRPDASEPLARAGQVLLPLFFVASGWSVNLAALNGHDLLVLVVLCMVAIVTKVVGGTMAARSSGLGWPEAGLIGVLLNTRGLTELIALNIGLQVGVIGTRLYTILVMMALVTTALTGPLIHLILGAAPTEAEAGTSRSLASGTTAVSCEPPDRRQGRLLRRSGGAEELGQ